MSWIKGIFSFVTGNVRLVVEYVLIGGLIAVAATAATLWMRAERLSEKNDALVGRVSLVETTNIIQDATIDNLQQMRKDDAKVMGDLLKDYKHVAAVDSVARKKLANLEKTSVPVRNYLDEPLPDELICMLNDSCTTEDPRAAGTGVPPGTATGTVRPPLATSPETKSRLRR